MGSKGRAEAGVLWWWRDGACCGNKQPETEINPASVICRQLPLFVPHQIGRFRPLPRTHDFIICLGGKLTHFGSLIPTPSPLFFYATKVPRDGACQLGGPGWAQTPKCGGPGGRVSFGGYPRGVSGCQTPPEVQPNTAARCFLLSDSQRAFWAVGDGRNGLPRWTPGH